MPVRPWMMRDACGHALRFYLRSIEEWWFDTTRGVRTAGNISLHEVGSLVGSAQDSVDYIPARVANARAALRDLPVRDPANYTFIDVGSGKGRMLFVAAEYSFRRIVGVEFSLVLHEQAQKNIARYLSRKQRCTAIESVLANAAEYEFPDGNLVIYMFNPFGAETMRRVLANLERSLKRSPRHMVVLLLWPESGQLLAAMDSMRLYRATRRWQVYETEVV